MLQCTKQLRMWGCDQAEATYYDLIAKDPDIVKVVLLLTGSIEGMKLSTTQFLSAWQPLGLAWQCRGSAVLAKQVRAWLHPDMCSSMYAATCAAETFDGYQFLWKNDMQLEYEQFMATHPSLEEFELQLKRFMEVEQVRLGQQTAWSLRQWWPVSQLQDVLAGLLGMSILLGSTCQHATLKCSSAHCACTCAASLCPVPVA